MYSNEAVLIVIERVDNDKIDFTEELSEKSALQELDGFV